MDVGNHRLVITPTKRNFDGRVVYRWELKNGLLIVGEGYELSESSAYNAANRAVKYLAQYPTSSPSSL